ncbi:MAG: HEAT repeat domain-containing protein [Acidobacteria bacterium]|nr:HEAT repeat domain-containing protein [Acidobacteriota bacterium]
MRNLTLLFVTGAMALLAQRDPLPPIPPVPRLAHEYAAKAAAHADAAMRHLEHKMAFAMSSSALFPAKASAQERSYDAGLRALDSRSYERALESFSQAAMTTGSRSDGALFRKAYALYALGRKDEASAALAELRRSHGSSRWMGDAQALEAEIKQGSGQIEDIRVAALSGLMHSDPEKAAPFVEQILKGSAFPKLQEQALRGISNSDSQRNRDLLTAIARGKIGNPDLQLRAIHSLADRRTDNRPLLREIYSSATDEQVKRAALRGLGAAEDNEELLRIFKAEKEASLRMEALSMMRNSLSPAELWTLYGAESSVEVKERILQRLKDAGATERLLEVAKTEKDLKLRQSAIRALGSATTGGALVAMYAAEGDQSVKRMIVDALYSHQNGKALVEVARKEKDPRMAQELVSRLSRMKSKEGFDYLTEILK